MVINFKVYIYVYCELLADDCPFLIDTYPLLNASLQFLVVSHAFLNAFRLFLMASHALLTAAHGFLMATWVLLVVSFCNSVWLITLRRFVWLKYLCEYNELYLKPVFKHSPLFLNILFALHLTRNQRTYGS